jgi:uncharacterized membrane protein
MPITAYGLLKLVHVIAVVLFVGNVTFGLYWVSHAERTGDARFIAHAMQAVLRSDRWFTWPGVVLLTLGGIGAAMAGHLRLFQVGWIFSSIGLLTFSGVVFALLVAPLQRRIVTLASDAAPSMSVLTAALRLWHRYGWLSLLPLWLAIAVMILKRPV